MIHLIGSVLFLIGMIIRFVSIRHNSEWSMSIHKPNELCVYGIYSRVRHPSYLGSIISMMGAYLICSYFGYFCIVFTFFLSRAIEEEKLLESDEYKTYRIQAGMFLPRIRRK